MHISKVPSQIKLPNQTGEEYHPLPNNRVRPDLGKNFWDCLVLEDPPARWDVPAASAAASARACTRAS